MSDNPSYVRLANRLSRGMLVDLESGWSIAGLDVQKFPESAGAKKFVKKSLNDGKLEPASKAEFEDAHEDDEAMLEAVVAQNPNFGNSPQEALIRRAHKAAQDKLQGKRGDQRSKEEVYDEEVRQPRQARRRTVEELPDDLESLGKPELQKLAEQRGLAKSGSKDDIIGRLVQHEEDEESEEDED